MTIWISQHTWAVPLILQFIWIAVCYGLLWVMTGGMAFQVAVFLLWMGSAFIWLFYGGFRLLVYLIDKWN